MGLTEVIASLVIGLPATVLAYLAYQRGSRNDEVAQENWLLQRLQEDNADLRHRLAGAEQRIAELLRERGG